MAVFTANYIKPIDTLCGQNAELVNVKECDAGHSGSAV
jgi:hypothetical protein